MAAFENTGVLFTDEVLQLMRPELEVTVNEADLDPRVSGSVLEALGFVQQATRFPKWVFTTRGGVLALPEIEENGERPRMSYKNGDEKGYKVKQFWGSYSITKLATKTIRDSGLDRAMFHPTVLEELDSLGSDIRDLGYSAKMAKEDMATKLLTEGFSITSSYGAGSAAPDGEALFSDAHASGDNLLTGAPTQINIKAGINLLRGMKNDKGARYRLPSMYTLACGVDNEETVRALLNDQSVYANQVDDVTISNSVTMNVFSAYEGFKVGLLVLETIGQPDADGNAIGTGNEWFMLDKDRLSKFKALKLITLWNAELDNYIDQKTKEFTIDIDLAFTVEHVKAEVGIVGSLGV